MKTDESTRGAVMLKLLKFLLSSLCMVPLTFGANLACKSISTRGSESMKDVYKSHVDMRGNNILSHCREHLKHSHEFKQQLINDSSKPFMKILHTYNDILVHIDAAMNQSSLFIEVHPSEKIQKDAEVCEQEVSRFVTELSLDKKIYEVLKAGLNETLPESAKRMLEHTLRDFRRAGVDKDDETRNKIKQLKNELVTISQEFSQNIRDDRFFIKLDSEKDLAGLPKDYIDSHRAGPDGKISISTDYPDYIPFMQYALSDQWRKELRFKYLNRGQKNKDILRDMIEKRNQLAKLLNYRSYADYVVEDKMIKKAKAIHVFIDKIADLAKKGADKEYKALLDFKNQQNNDGKTIYGHESAYLEEAFKKEKFQFDSQLVRPYFSYERVRDGLLSLTSRLFNIQYHLVDDAQVWHESVVTYDVYDEQGKLGRIYLDMHPRDRKYKHAAQFTVLSGLSDRQYPQGALVCNFPNPKDGPALMEHRQVVTMFHEFGHLLHHLFAGKQEWMQFSGVATEWDFVEAPSQFLEEWAWAPEILEQFALHYETNDPIPNDLVKKMRAADEFGKAISARQQMFYAALSLNYYDLEPNSFDLLELLKSLQEKYSYFPYEEGTNFHYSFGHLDGYSAMYYTYMWSLSLAKDLFEPFKKDGLLNKQQAIRFRDFVLKPGGAKDANQLVEDFLGRPFKFDAFENWLTADPLEFNKW
jgi:thimet oligopeptidase